MKVQVITAWQNYTVRIQRRTNNLTVNAIGEPDYQSPDSWPIVPDVHGNNTHKVRIEFNAETLSFTPSGERTVQNQTIMLVRSDEYIQPEDRVTILNTNANPLLNMYFIIMSVLPENDAVGNISHFVAELQTV